jgi:cytochrome d ubiquinol oxidase subunit II
MVSDSLLLVAVALVASLTAYALLGGADYGGGVWDLLATGASARRQRDTIAHAIGPIWEANHVWLIVAVVILFTALPHAFAAMSTFLHVPLLLVLIGIVLRGSAFVFRAYGPDDPRHERFWGRVFAIASTTTPVFLGITVGALTEGRLPARPEGTFHAVYIAPWLTPFSTTVGALALTLFAYLAAVYLTLEAADDEPRAAFRLRALASGVLSGVLAGVVLVLAPTEVQQRLIASQWALALHAVTGAAAVTALLSLWHEQFHLARVAAAAQVTLILWGWALAQYPHAIRPHLTLSEAAAPDNVLVLLLLVLAGGSVIVVPSLAYLFGIFGPRGR